MSFVLDSSAMLALLLPDERSTAADKIGQRLVSAPAQVPAVWPLEVRNALLVALRARRLNAREFDQTTALLEALPIEVDPGVGSETLSRMVDIARRNALSVYDASYLELAERLGLPLATFDTKLARAAATLKLPLLG